ncbi:conserved hypothetical protein [Ricinus communis]|uniref:Uncharacterized protein n=1 Tax=Ricinus communis TaxID=3988 RepID=B9RUB0_RICCO|nr:conserved hypothetical protein [Ricinus communis]
MVVEEIKVRLRAKTCERGGVGEGADGGANGKRELGQESNGGRDGIILGDVRELIN